MAIIELIDRNIQAKKVDIKKKVEDKPAETSAPAKDKKTKVKK